MALTLSPIHSTSLNLETSRYRYDFKMSHPSTPDETKSPKCSLPSISSLIEAANGAPENSTYMREGSRNSELNRSRFTQITQRFAITKGGCADTYLPR